MGTLYRPSESIPCKSCPARLYSAKTTPLLSCDFCLLSHRDFASISRHGTAELLLLASASYPGLSSGHLGWVSYHVQLSAFGTDEADYIPRASKLWKFSGACPKLLSDSRLCVRLCVRRVDHLHSARESRAFWKKHGHTHNGGVSAVLHSLRERNLQVLFCDDYSARPPLLWRKAPGHYV